MTTINERVKIIRKSEKLNEKEKMTLERFGARLGVQKSAISKIETGQVGVSDQMFLSICREFDVNPEWLRSGDGPMFLEKTRNEEISDFINDILKNEPDGIRARFISCLSKLDADDWERIANIAKSLVEEQKEKDAEAAAAAERQRMHDDLDRQLDLEEKAGGRIRSFYRRMIKWP